ncbi:MAG TPA: GEVED domain-containing protein [Ferruginibacter sp.]|nr:GEVED domain-containing protein [Ferruginibacter sp.]
MHNKSAKTKTPVFTVLSGLFKQVFILLLGFLPLAMQGQTTLVSPSGDGGFENGGTLGANGWVAVNAATDGWVTGTLNPPGASAGTRSAFVSSTGGSSWTYSQVSTVTHIYKEFTLPAGEPIADISFKWKAQGEGTTTSDWDNLKVFVAPTSVTPTTTAEVASLYQVVGTGATNGMYKLNSANYNTSTLKFTGVAGQTYRLIFSWKSDITDIANPPAAIDEVSVVSRAEIVANAAPINFSITASLPTSFTINWEDNSTNETSFNVYRSFDGVNYTLINNTASTSTATTGTGYSLAQTSMLPGETYYYRIAAVTELESAYLSGNHTTTGAGTTIFSTTTGGLWSQTGTWVGGVVPTAADDVVIADGATVTIDQNGLVCKNLTVGEGGASTLLYAGAVTTASLTVSNNVTVSANASFLSNNGTGTKTLNIGGLDAAGAAAGNLTVNGTFDMAASATNHVTVNFRGVQAASISGSGPICNFRAIVVNKGTGTIASSTSVLNIDRVITQLAPTTTANFLTITAGVFKINSASVLTPYYGAQTVCASIGALWLNHAGASVSSVGTGTLTGPGTLTVSGWLTIDNGTFAYGTGATNLAFSNAASRLNMSGGTLNAFGTITFTSTASIQFNMSGGNINVDVQAAANATATAFSVGSATAVNWSGGTITIIDPHAGTSFLSFSMPFSVSKVVTGGTLRIGDGISGTPGAAGNTGGFGLSAGNTIRNLEINNRVDLSPTRMLRIAGNSFIGGNIEIFPNGYVFTGSGTSAFVLVHDGASFINNGVLAGTEPGGTQSIGTVQFSSTTGNQVLSGSGTFVQNNALSLASTGLLTFNQTNQYVVNRLNFFRGSLANTDKITVGLGGSSSPVIQRGGIAASPAPVFDNLPTFNIGTGGLALVYATSSGTITTGPEIPATRSIASFAMVNPQGTILDGGALSTVALVLNAANPGLLTTSSTNLLTVTGTITGASATSYINGPMEWVLPSGLTGTTNYLLPVGKTTYNPFELVAPQTSGGTVTVKAEVIEGNSNGTAGNLLSSLKTNRYWNGEITSGASNLTQTRIRLYDTPAGADAIGASSTANGTYDFVGGFPPVITGTSITTAAPDVTSLTGYYVMGNLASPVISNLTITPNGDQCTHVSRSVSVTVTPGGAPITNVVINYSVNSVPQTPISMTNTSGNDWEGVIPTVSPTDAEVTWSVSATDGNNLVSSANGATYRDEAAAAAVLNVSATPSEICAGTPSQLSVNITGLSSAYCTPVYTDTDGASGDYINNFSFADLVNNNSGDEPTDYTYYSALTANLVAGNTYPISIQAGGTSNLYEQQFRVWIDYNQDGVFDASESVYSSTSATFFPNLSSGNVTIPLTAYNGVTRMRVVSKYSSLPAITENCSIATSWGETEDYNIVITGGTTGPLSPASYSWSDGTNTVGTTNPLEVSPTANTSYTVTVTFGNGCTKTSDPVVLNVTPAPAGPTSSVGSTQCGTGVPTAFFTGGLPGLYRWYLTPTGGTPLSGEVNQELTSYTISTTTTFYVSIFDGNCESERLDVTAVVTTPDAINASVDFASTCEMQEIELSVSQTGSNNEYEYTWTASPEAGSGITGSASGDVISITPTIAGTYTYTVTAVDDVANCITTSQVVVTVKDGVSDIVINASPAQPCVGGTTNLSVTSNPGTVPPVNIAINFEAAEQPFPGWTFLNNGDGNNWALGTTAQSGTQALAYQYSSIANADVWAISPAATLKAGNSYAITFWYRVQSASFPEKLKVTVGNAATVVAQSQILWNNNGGASLNNTTYAQGVINFVPATTGVYYFGFNCYSDADQWILWLDNISITGSGDADPTYSWVSDPAGFTSSVQNPQNVQVNEPTTYTVTITNAFGCASSDSYLVTPLELPEAPIGTDSEHCGNVVPEASVASGGVNGSGTFNWYDAVSGGNLLQSSTSTTYISTVSTSTTFYVSEIGANGCESERTPVAVTVIEADPLSLSATDTEICIGQSTDLSVSQTGSNNTYDLSWSASPAGSGVDGSETGAFLTITPTLPGVYTYMVTGNDVDKGCITNTNIIITVNGLPEVTQAAATPAITCSGGTVSLSANSSPATISGTIGTGTGTNTTSTYPAAFGTYWGNSRAQYLITAADLTAGGLTAGYIQSVTFDVTQLGSPATANGYTIRMGTTAINTITATIPDPSMVVYGPVDYTPTLGLNTLQFSSPFYWNGSSNVFVEICLNNLVIGSSNALTRLTTTSYTSSGYVGNDNTSGSICNAALTNGATSRPNMVFNGLVAPDPTGNYTYTWNPGNLIGATIPVNPTANTTYSVTATNNVTGCVSLPIEVDVVIQPLTAAAEASASTSCAGETITLNVVAGGGAPFQYSWSDGTSTFSAIQSPVVNPTTTTTYTVTVTDICNNQTTDQVTVTVNSLPDASIVEAGPFTICAPGTQTLNASTTTPDPAYQWKRNGVDISGANGASYVATETGSYTVQITENGTGCSNVSAPVSVTIHPLPSAITFNPATPGVCSGTATAITATSFQGEPSTATVGTGTVSNTTTTPYKGFWGGQKVQFLYLASELNALGMVTGSPITTLGMNVTSFTGPYTYNGFSIGMKHTTATSLTSTLQTGLTSVFGPTDYTLTGTAPFVVSHTLSNAFVWDGTSNIVVEYCFNNNNGGGSSANSANVASTTVTGRTVYYSNDNFATVCTNATGTTSSTRANMRFTFGVPANITWSPYQGLFTDAAATTPYNGEVLATVYAMPASNETYTATSTSSTGCSVEEDVNITVSPTLTVGADIDGPDNACAHTTGNPVAVYTIVTANETSITWDIPAGATNVSGQGTNTLSFNYPPAYPGGTLSVTVTGGPGCAPITRNLAIGVVGPMAPVVSGPINVCPFVGNNTPVVYTVTPDPSVVSYNWVVPPNVNIISGQGTGTLTVTFAAGFTQQSNKQIRVTGFSGCANSPMTIYYLLTQFPSSAGPITGPTDVCGYLDNAEEATYSIDPVRAAESYLWTVPAGVTIVGGQGTTQLTVTFDNTFVTSALSVRAVNSCGTSTQRSITVSRTGPSTPSLISGPRNVCLLMPTAANPGGTPATYSVNAVAGNTYNWQVPAGATILSGQGTHSIEVSFDGTYTSGNISVTASTSCGTSAPRTLSLNVLMPGAPVAIDVLELGLCPDRLIQYSLAAVPSNATGLIWTVPSGATIMSGQGTPTIVVSYPPTPLAGTVTVTAFNGCGTSATRSRNVKLEGCDVPPPPLSVVKDGGVKEVPALTLEVDVFPNPSTQVFNVQAKSANMKTRVVVKVMDNLGRVMESHNMMPGETQPIGTRLKAGSYFIEVMQGNERVTKRVIKF